MRCVLLLGCLVWSGGNVASADVTNPLTAPEARKMVGETITVEMKVQAAKDRLEKRGEIYLDAEADFRDEKNFAVVITNIGDAGLEHLCSLGKLQMLELTGTQVTDAGMANLGKLACLKEPGHDATQPIVAGATPPAGLPPLPGFALGDTRVGDAGIDHLRALRGIQRLELNNTQVTDVGLAAVHGLTQLSVIDVRGAKVSPTGGDALRKALPKVRVTE